MEDKSYVLDTSALFAFTKGEEGSAFVEEILNLAKKKKAAVYLSFICLMELYYITWQEKGQEAARELIILIQSLPLEKVHSAERLILSAGWIKANYQLSVADAIIAATALEKEAVLVHKDPEFKALSDKIKMVDLPFKLSGRKS